MSFKLSKDQLNLMLARVEFIDTFPDKYNQQNWRQNELKKSGHYEKGYFNYEGVKIPCDKLIKNPNYTPLTENQKNELDKKKTEIDEFESEWCKNWIKENFNES